jgi:Flp pilus assembly CpaE family ATPase
VSDKRIGLIVNQTSPVMALTGEEIGRRLGVEPGYVIQAMPNACYAAVTRGAPIVDLAPQLPAARLFSAFAEAIHTNPGVLARTVEQFAAQPLVTG